MNGPEPTDWKVHWEGYLSSGYSSLLYILTALLALIVRPGRKTFFLTLAILSQLGMVIAVPMVDPRYGYPVIPPHIILSLFALAPLFQKKDSNCGGKGFMLFSAGRIYLLCLGAVCLLVFFTLCYLGYGKNYQFRPLMEKAMLIEPSLSIEKA